MVSCLFQMCSARSERKSLRQNLNTARADTIYQEYFSEFFIVLGLIKASMSQTIARKYRHFIFE